MSLRSPDDAPENPFCTRCVRPGAIPFRFPSAMDVADLADQFCAAGCRGAIVGPHGSGKSTLLAALVVELQRRGHAVCSLALHDGQHWLPQQCCGEQLVPGAILVVDGYEQLGLLGRWRLRWLCHRRRLGLLVTSHRSTGFPLLFRTEGTLPLAQAIVARLQEGYEPRVLPDDVAREFPRCRGDLRELLFRLFDLYEARSRKGR